MNPTEEAAAILADRRLTGNKGDRLPLGCRPADLAAGIAIQNAVSEQWCGRMHDSVGAWKCGLPSDGKIVIAPIYSSTIHRTSPVALWPHQGRARIEPELAFVLKTDLPARGQPYSEAEIDAAIGQTHLALELLDCRYHDPQSCSFPEMLADGLVNQGLYIGPAIDGTLARSAREIALSVSCQEECRSYPGEHPAGLPREPLYWLVEYLRRTGNGLQSGQAVITGSYAGAIEIPLDDGIEIRYEGLGAMTVRFESL